MKTYLNQLSKLPVVILPLEDYERMKEDLEMLRSQKLPETIKKARREVTAGKVYTLGEIKKVLSLS